MGEGALQRVYREAESERETHTHTVDCAEILESRTVNHVDANANLCQMLGITQMFSSQHFASLFVYFGLIFFILCFFEPKWIGLPLFFTGARSQCFCLFIFDFVIAFKIFQRFRFNPSYLICCGDSTVCHIFCSHANGVHCVNLSQHTIVPTI